MNCSEATNLLPLFFDGELDAKQMRAVSLHAAACAQCDAEVRDLQLLRDTLRGDLAARVDDLDLSKLWPAIERRLPVSRRPQVRESRWRQWLSSPSPAWWVGVPVAAAAATALAFALFSGVEPNAAPDAGQIATVDYSNAIERLDSDLDSVAVFHDPDTSATLLWVSDTGPISEDLQ